MDNLVLWGLPPDCYFWWTQNCCIQRTQNYRFCRSSKLSLLWEKLNGLVLQEPSLMQRKFVWMGTFLRRRCREENWTTYYHLNVSWPWIQMALGATFWIWMPDWRLDKRTYLDVINEMGLYFSSHVTLLVQKACEKMVVKRNHTLVFTWTRHLCESSSYWNIASVERAMPWLTLNLVYAWKYKQNSYGLFVFYVWWPYTLQHVKRTCFYIFSIKKCQLKANTI